MKKNWELLENMIRDLASVIWQRPCHPKHIDGVNFDGYIDVSEEEVVLIEITKQKSLQKIREDIAKIQAIKTRFALENIIARSFIVLSENPTDSMIELGAAQKISVVSKDEFIRKAFDFESYKFLRNKHSFGSAINPTTGEIDRNSYIPVGYIDENKKSNLSIEDICLKLSKGFKIILLGEYGTGKSRCTKETFEELARGVEKYSSLALSVNLREHWGASTGVEIIAGHLKKMGLSSSIDRTMQLMNDGHIVLILDGFDEVGSQTFGMKRESIRREALSGIRDLIKSCKAGVLITGRPHYFNSNKEMYDCLGINIKNAEQTLLQCAEEFDDKQAEEYVKNIGLSCDIPSWLPKKPLIFHIIEILDRDKARDLLSTSSGGVGFWSQFLDIVCERESRIHHSIDPLSVRNVLENLARRTRFSTSLLGRLTPKDVNSAYEDATGSVPDESGQLMLSRLCSLGRIEPESPDRQFVDPIILQFLYIDCLTTDISNKDFSILNASWNQSLNEKGVIFLAETIENLQIHDAAISFIMKNSSFKNNQAVAEIVSSLALISDETLDFSGIQISGAEFSLLKLDRCEIKNITISDSIFSRLEFDSCKTNLKSETKIVNSEIVLATGLTSESSIPPWVINTKAESLQSVSTSSRIKSSNLPAAQKLFLSIIQKIFFQRGGGRKESSLYKGGFGQQYDRKLIDSILALLVNEGYVEKSKDNSGFIYNPKREYMARMKAIKDQLTLSNDELWIKVLDLEK